MTTYNTSEKGKGFDEENETAAYNLRHRLERLLPQSIVTINRTNNVWAETSTSPVNVESMAIMVIGRKTFNNYFETAFSIATKMPLLIIDQLPVKRRIMMPGVLVENCSDEELLNEIRRTFALGTVQGPSIKAAA